MNKRQRMDAPPEPPSLVPSPLAGLASLLLPGLGQILTRAYRRGFLLIASSATMVGLPHAGLRACVEIFKHNPTTPIMRK